MFKSSHKTIIPFIVLTFPLIIDCLNGILRGSTGEENSIIGILFRGLIIGYSFINGALKSEFILKSIYYSILYIITQIILGSFSFSCIIFLIKILYAFFVLVILLKNKKFEDIENTINFALLYGVGASIVLITSFIFGFGYSAYVDGGFGTKGFFIAMNDVGLTILILNGLSCLYYQKTRKKLYLLYTLIMFTGSCLIGSMAGFFGSAILFIGIFTSIILFRFSNYRSNIKEKVIILLISFVIITFLIQTFVTIILEDAYLSKKYSDLSETILSISGRGILIDGALYAIKTMNPLNMLFGLGKNYDVLIGNYVGGGKDFLKSAEVDPLDLYGTFGLILTILILYYPIKTFITSLYYYSKYKSIDNYWIFIITTIFIIHSIYGGHAFTSPLSYSYYILCIYIMVKYKQLKFK